MVKAKINIKVDSSLHDNMDTLGIEPRASRMLGGCDTTTPCAQLQKDIELEADG